MWRERRSWERFERNGGLLWAEYGRVLSVAEVRGIRSTSAPECDGWAGQIVVAEDQIAWAASRATQDEHGLISLLQVLSLERQGPLLQVAFVWGNPRSPARLQGFLADVMADRGVDTASFDFARESVAERTLALIASQRDAARARWPSLVAPHI